MWPTVAPIGLHAGWGGPDGKRIIIPDASMAPAVKKMFERYATGRFSLKEIAACTCRRAGLPKERQPHPDRNGASASAKTDVLRRL